MKKRIVCFLLAVIMIMAMVPAAAVTANAASEWTTSTKAIKVLKELEGFEENAYQVNGEWYIGYGSKIKEGDYPNGISEDDALKLVQDQVFDSIDVAINNFTEKNNLNLASYQHDAIALFCYRLGTDWLSDSTSEYNALREAIRTGATGNAFINTIGQFHGADISDAEGLKAAMNRRLSEANMYLNNGYGYYPPSNLTYVVMDENGNEEADSGDYVIAYNSASGYNLKNISDSSFLGWYVFDGKADGDIDGAAISKLDGTTAGKIIVAKFDDGSGDGSANYGNADYKINTSSLPSLYFFHKVYSKADVEAYKNSMDELAKGKLKKNTTFAVDSEVMVDGIKWIRGIGKDTNGKKAEGWVYMGELPESGSTAAKVIATAKLLKDLDIHEGATEGSKVLETIPSGTTVNIYEIKVEGTETGNKSWGKVSVTIGSELYIGWINLAYADVKEVSNTDDSAAGRTGKIVNTEQVNVRKDAGVHNALITTLKKGTAVTVLETKMVGTAQWGLVEWTGLKDGYTKGWVYMHYVEAKGLEHSNGAGGTGSTDAALYTGIVTSNINLNVREYADIYAPKVTSLPTGTKINIYEVANSRNMKWGRIGDGQWVCLSYVSLTEVNNSGTAGGTVGSATTSMQATVTVNSLDILKNYNNNAGKIGTLTKGEVVTIIERNTEETETGTRIWGRILKDGLDGWINLAYVDLKTVTSVGGSVSSGTTSGGSTSVSNTPAVISNCLSVNVREAAGVSSAAITKLRSGTSVVVHEQITHDKAPWARITWNNGADEGWVCMYYVTLNASGTNSDNSGTVSGTNSNTISATGYVNHQFVNVRGGAGLGYAQLGTLSQGTKVTIYEQVVADGMIWGKITYNNAPAYVCMSYITVESSSSTGVGVMGTIARCFSAVNVRSAPGTGNALVGTIQVGSRVEVFEQRLYSNQYWGRVAQGWVCMDYVLLDAELPEGTIMDATQPTTEATNAPEVPQETINRDNEVLYTIKGTITTGGDDLIVRNNASSTSAKVGSIKDGLEITVLAVKSNNAQLWGRVDQYATAGWINMDYVTYSVHGYVNTDEQPVYLNADTGSTVKGNLSLNTELTITKLSADTETVFGWVDRGSVTGWIPMGRISNEKIDVIPTYKKYTHGHDTIGGSDLFTGTTNTAVNAYSAINGGEIVFKLQPGVSVPVGEIKLEGGVVWGKVVAHKVVGWIDLSAVNYTVTGYVIDVIEAHKTKVLGVEENIHGYLDVGNVSICGLSFDSNGHLWGTITGTGTELDGAYVVIRMNYGDIYISGILN